MFNFPIALFSTANKYQTSILNTSPIHYWRCGDSSSPLADLGSNPKNISLTGSFTLQSTSLITDTINTAVNFSGGFGTFTDTVLTPPYTLEFWIRPNTTLNNYGGILSESTSLCLVIRSTGVLQLFPKNGSTFTVPANQNSYCTIEVSSTDILYTLNATTTSSIATTGNNMTIRVFGSTGTAGENFLGSLDEVAVYNYLLGSTNRQAHYLAGTT